MSVEPDSGPERLYFGVAREPERLLVLVQSIGKNVVRSRSIMSLHPLICTCQKRVDPFWRCCLCNSAPGLRLSLREQQTVIKPGFVPPGGTPDKGVTEMLTMVSKETPKRRTMSDRL